MRGMSHKELEELSDKILILYAKEYANYFCKDECAGEFIIEFAGRLGDLVGGSE